MYAIDVRTQSRGIGSLPLNSLEIHRFRAFRHLVLDRLGRVNLIVGKNNVGKTCVLEALQIYARNGWPDVIWNILEGRDEVRRAVEPGFATEGTEDDILAVRSLFYGRPDILASGERNEPIRIGPIDDATSTLSINVNWYLRQASANPSQLQLFDDADVVAFNGVDNVMPRFTIQIGQQSSAQYPIDSSRYVYRRLRNETSGIQCAFIRSSGLGYTQVGDLYDTALKKGQDDEVLDALRIISPSVERLNFIGDRQRIPIVKFTGAESPVPLKSLGDGMYRLLGIAASLASVSNGLLLIDEIETGLHYSVQRAMWSLVFHIARRLNVQVFATTHSWDCIEAFQQAAQEDDSEGMLVRLQDKEDGNSVATLFDEHELKIVTRRQLEVR